MPGSVQNLCPTCREPIAPNAPFGQCPRCLLGFASGTGLDRDLPADDLIVDGQKRRIAGYELIEEIARGGMGIVYRARQTALGREVALKMLASGDLAPDEAVQRFRNEASAAAGLRHPHIVPVYEIGEEETGHYFTMRFVPGGRNIADWARSLPPEGRSRRIAVMLAKVARAITHAHEHGVLHRDLKPSNLLIDEEDEPQVTDFGLARLYREVDSGLTLTRQILGSPSYMAPEQAEGRRADETTLTDVYGLGAVLYEMLSGRPPFVADSPLSTARKVVEEMPARLGEVHRDLGTICLKCLEKEPARRYPSAQALAEDLERFSRGEPIRARPLTTPEALWRWAKRRPKTAALLGGFFIALVAGFSGVTSQWLRAEQAVAHLRWLEVVRQAEGEEAPLALASLASKLRHDPDHWEAAMLAMSIVDRQSFPLRSGPAVVPTVPLITAPVLSAEGDWFAAGEEGGGIRVWETATGQARDPLLPGSVVTALAAGTGRIVLAAATEGGEVFAWTSLEDPPVLLPGRSGGTVIGLGFSGDGSCLMGRGENAVELWWDDPSRGSRVFRLGDSALVGASLAAEGASLLLCSKDRAALVETATGTVLQEVAARAQFRAAQLSLNGARFCCIDGLYTIRTWEAGSGAEHPAIDAGVTSWKKVLLNADGTRLVAIGSTNDLALFDTVSGLRVTESLRHLYSPSDLAASADGLRFASHGWDGRTLVWDFATGALLVEAVWDDAQNGADLAMNRDGSRWLVLPRALRKGAPAISVWEGSATRPPRVRAVPGCRDFTVTTLSPDGRLGGLGLGPDTRAFVYEIATGRSLLDVPTRGYVYAHLFSPDQRRYYALTDNGWLYGWDLETGMELWPPGQQPGKVRPSAISPDGSRIVAGHNDGHLRIYDTATGRQVRELDHPGEIKVVRFAPDGSDRFLSASTDRLAHVWDLASGEKLATMEGHDFTIIAAGWSPDGRLVATASYDQTSRLWDSATGEPVGVPMEHLAWLSHVEISPDGRRLATACRDGTARLWEVPSGRPLSAPLPLGSTAMTVRFTADSRTLLARDHLGFRWFGVEQAEPVTVHYPAVISSGLGMDSETWRAIVNPDGTGVFLGHSMNEGQYWTVPQPRGAVPIWFPRFLEGLAGMREVAPGDVRLLPPRDADDAVPAESGDVYAVWARERLGRAAAR